MRTHHLTAIELLLIAPAGLFMTALLVRSLQPLQNQLAQSANDLIQWYAARMWTLWVLLLALPFTALGLGCAALMNRHEAGEAHSLPLHTMLPVAAVTAIAAAILAIVILHMLAN
jgi:hypothetical protein